MNVMENLHSTGTADDTVEIRKTSHGTLDWYVAEYHPSGGFSAPRTSSRCRSSPLACICSTKRRPRTARPLLVRRTSSPGAKCQNNSTLCGFLPDTSSRTVSVLLALSKRTLRTWRTGSGKRA